MLKKTIKHLDLDGNPTETDAYFNLTKAEAIELNIRNDLEVIGRSRNNNEIMDTFKRILQMSYGKRTGGGEFIKEGFPAFAASEAYSELFMEIWMNPEYAQEFIKGILPAGILPQEGQGSQADIPARLADHSSMQGYKAKTPPSGPSGGSDVPAQTQAEKNDYQEYLAFKASRAAQTPPDRVSPPEAPQQTNTAREDLI